MDPLQLLSLPLIAGLAVSFLIEQGLTPKPLLPWRRVLPTVMLHCGVWLTLFDISLLLCQRPWFVVVILWAFQLLLVLVNQAKYDSLREAFIFQDFEYFTDAIKHPRLYLPFFGVARTVAATVGFLGAVAVGILLEPPLTDTLALPVFISVLLAVLLPAQLLCGLGNNWCPAPAENPNEDLRELGQIAFLWSYWQAENLSAVDLTATPFKNLPHNTNSPPFADIIVIQSESFFDLRSLSDTINPAVLQHFDQIKTEARHHGRLQVPAWGANTVRTECGFLSGLTPEQLGIHRFNPYRVLAKQGIPNLVGFLKQTGYRTLCIHPYHATFYLRDKVFPRMGFDEFIDLSGFDASQKYGQFIGDLAIADKIQELLDTKDSRPLFIFVITMENHGPLHLEKPDLAKQGYFYHTQPESGCDDLTVYLQHLQNADLMIKRLKDSLLATQNAGLLCWYGDHVPIMPSVYQRFGEPDGMSDYFIWRTASVEQHNPVNQNLAIHELASLLLKHGGFGG